MSLSSFVILSLISKCIHLSWAARVLLLLFICRRVFSDACPLSRPPLCAIFAKIQNTLVYLKEPCGALLFLHLRLAADLPDPNARRSFSGVTSCPCTAANPRIPFISPSGTKRTATIKYSAFTKKNSKRNCKKSVQNQNRNKAVAAWWRAADRQRKQDVQPRRRVDSCSSPGPDPHRLSLFCICGQFLPKHRACLSFTISLEKTHACSAVCFETPRQLDTLRDTHEGSLLPPRTTPPASLRSLGMTSSSRSPLCHQSRHRCHRQTQTLSF